MGFIIFLNFQRSWYEKDLTDLRNTYNIILPLLLLISFTIHFTFLKIYYTTGRKLSYLRYRIILSQEIQKPTHGTRQVINICSFIHTHTFVRPFTSPVVLSVLYIDLENYCWLQRQTEVKCLILNNQINWERLNYKSGKTLPNAKERNSVSMDK